MTKKFQPMKVLKHHAWVASQKAGVLRNGRTKIGQVLGQRWSKAERSRALCRGRYRSEE
jgi:hypothetical protein